MNNTVFTDTKQTTHHAITCKQTAHHAIVEGCLLKRGGWAFGILSFAV